jgi:hypothetical protein
VYWLRKNGGCRKSVVCHYAHGFVPVLRREAITTVTTRPNIGSLSRSLNASSPKASILVVLLPVTWPEYYRYEPVRRRFLDRFLLILMVLAVYLYSCPCVHATPARFTPKVPTIFGGRPQRKLHTQRSTRLLRFSAVPLKAWVRTT